MILKYNFGQKKGQNMDASAHVNTWMEVKPIHCHKRLDKNTLVRKLRCITEDKKHCELSLKFKAKELEFFYDHEIDHLPGMLQICALRQCSLALAHLVYAVPMDHVTVLDWIKVKLYNYAELGVESTVKSNLIDIKREKYKITLILEGLLIQKNYPTIRMRGKLIALSPKLAEKIRFKKSFIENLEGVQDDETFDC